MSKLDANAEDEELTDKNSEQEWTVSLASACALENVALIIKDDILQAIYDFIMPLIFSGKWTSRYCGLLAIGSIV